MRARLLVVAFAGLVAIGFTPARVAGEPVVEPVRHANPPPLRVEIDGMETVRELRFAGPIVQTVETDLRASASEPRARPRERASPRGERCSR